MIEPPIALAAQPDPLGERDRNGHWIESGDLVAVVDGGPPFVRGTVQSVEPDRVTVRTETKRGYVLRAVPGGEVVVIRKAGGQV